MNGLEMAVQLRNHVDVNRLAAALWLRLIYAEDPDAEAERITDDMSAMASSLAAIVKAAQPLMLAYYDAAGPN